MDRLPSSKIIFLFLFLGFLTGTILEKTDIFLGINFYNVFDLFATIFINSLKMIVVPLIMSSLIFNISAFNSTSDISGLGLKTVFFYLSTSLVAIIIGIFVVNLIQPGLVNGVGAANAIGLNSDYKLDTLVKENDNISLLINEFKLRI